MEHETLKRGRQDGGNQVKKKHRDHFGMQRESDDQEMGKKRHVKEQIIRENKNGGKNKIKRCNSMRERVGANLTGRRKSNEV